MSEYTNVSHEEAVTKLREMIKGIKFAMLSTVEDDGTVRSRPMATQELETDGTLWFFTGKSTPKAAEIKHDQHVNISYAAPDKNRYVSVSGRAEIIDDRAKAEELWNPFYKAWFPDGLDDPDLCLIRVTVQKAEYWDAPGSPIAHLFGLAKAMVTGQQADVGENEKLSL